MEVINSNKEEYKVPFSVNDIYINDPEKKINIHID